MYRHQYSLATALALACGVASIACAEVRIEGSPMEVRVTTNQDSIADVLSALATTFKVKYRTAIPLDGVTNATYTGSFGQVVSRLLDGYNYVVKRDGETTEIVVFGKRGAVSSSPQSKPSQPKEILSRWR